jgi:hypothetical protein
MTLGILTTACSGPTLTPAQFLEVADPGPMAPIDQFPTEFMLRQFVTASWGEQGDAQSFEAVVQQVDGVLTILALSRSGQTGFVVTYDGADVSIENHTDRELPFPPEFMVGDVQRVFYPWPHQTYGDVSVTEDVVDGRPSQRTFSRPTESGQQTTTVELSDWGEIVPAHAELRSWYGYTLSIETYEQTVLP